MQVLFSIKNYVSLFEPRIFWEKSRRASGVFHAEWRREQKREGS